jgi:hypothetical protein
VWSTIIRSQPCSNENQVYIKKCSEAGILRGDLDPVMFHPFRANVAMEEVNRRPDKSQLYWVYPVLKKVGTLARAMGYLVRETVLPCGSMLMDHPARGQPPYVLSLSHRGSRKRCL